MKKLFVVVLVMSFVLFFAGHLISFAGGSKGGKEASNTLNILCFEGYAEPEWLDPFIEKTGAQVNITLATATDEIFSKMIANGGQGIDVISIDTSLFKRYYDSNLIKPVNTKNIANYKNILADFQNLKVTEFEGKQYGIPYVWGTIPLFYNADVLTEKPDSWEIMWDSKVKGKVVLLDEPQNTMTTMAIYLGLPDLWNFSEGDFTKLKEAFKSLGPQLRTITAGATDEINLIANDEVVIGLAFGEQTGVVARHEGFNINLAIPKEGALAWLDCWTLSAGCQNEKLAEEWINWTIEEKNAKAVVELIGQPSSTGIMPEITKDYDTSRLIWLEPRGDYQALTDNWTEIKLLLGK
jgi:putative spermidine/putrescine transport system substrate-binding protein/spermidine/putrescine transport system substrate-binding protein